jgi:putative transposase
VPEVGWLAGRVAWALPSSEAVSCSCRSSTSSPAGCSRLSCCSRAATARRNSNSSLVLRHELSILRRRARRPQLRESDRLVLAALSRVVPRRLCRAFFVTPETLLRWHRRIVACRWTYPHRRPGRPPIEQAVRELILRLACENSHWGYVRIVGELRKLGVTVSATLVRNVLARAGIPPAPERAASSWRSFLRQHRNTILACDLFTVDTVWLRRLYVLFFVSIGTRRVEYVACTGKPDTAWMSQQARNLLMDLDDRSQRPRFLIHDRDTKFSRAFDGIFRSEGVEIVRTPIQAPNANAHAERWVGSVRRECLDRLLISGRRQLEHVLRVYIRHFNQQRPHRALDLRPPDRGSGTDPSPRATVYPLQGRRRDLLGGLIHEYEAAA